MFRDTRWTLRISQVEFTWTEHHDLVQPTLNVFTTLTIAFRWAKLFKTKPIVVQNIEKDLNSCTSVGGLQDVRCTIHLWEHWAQLPDICFVISFSHFHYLNNYENLDTALVAKSTYQPTCLKTQHLACCVHSWRARELMANAAYVGVPAHAHNVVSTKHLLRST